MSKDNQDRMTGLQDPYAVHRLRMAEARAAERARLAAVAALGQVPPQCGPDICPAPARGPVELHTPHQLLPKGADDWQVVPTGYAGRTGLRCADAFSVARDAVRRQDTDAPAPFTASQVAIGRHYRALVERHSAGGVKCASIDARCGDGTGGDFMDTWLAMSREIEMLRARIGTGPALELRRVRPSVSGGAGRRAIMARRLVDDFCLADMSLSAILRAHGWATTATVRARARDALCGLLDQMAGPVAAKRSRVWHKGG